MSEVFYQPLDSIINPAPHTTTTMAEIVDMSAGLTKEKLDAIQVDVAELSPESPQAEFDQLTMRSPRIFPSPGPRHGNNRPFSPGIVIDGRPVPNPKGRPGFTDGRPAIPEGRPGFTVGRPVDDGCLRPASPTGSVRSSYSSTRRRVSRHTHWSGGHSHWHRSEVSKELTLAAESEFLALMELMSGISRRSTSLKEVWMKIITERESFCTELDRMYERCEEYSETIERHERERHSHTHEHEERKKEVTKLRLELSAAVSSSTEYKKKLHDRDCELSKSRSEVSELTDNLKYSREQHEMTKRTLEETQLKLVAMEDRCHHAEQDAKKHQGDCEAIDLKYSELQSTYKELDTKFKSTHKEVSTLRQSISVYKQEKHEWLHEQGELRERERKCHGRIEELKCELEELQESYEKKVHELRETSEILTKVKYEREESEKKVKELRRKLHEKGLALTDCEERCSKWKLKWEHYDREITSIREELQTSKTEITRLEESVTKKTEEYRLLVIEHKQLKKDHHDKCEENECHHRDIIMHKESIRRLEVEIKEKTELIHSLHERIERVERNFEETTKRCSDLQAERNTLNSSIVKLNLEIERVTEEYTVIKEKYHQCEIEYEEHRNSYTEIHESHSGFEHEISSLRSMLREVRQERESAISMRVAADRERDEARARYEAKCREADKLEERLHEFEHGHHGHHHGRPGFTHPIGGPVRIFSQQSQSSAQEGTTVVAEASMDVVDNLDR